MGVKHGEIHVDPGEAPPLAPLPEPALEAVAAIATELEQPAPPPQGAPEPADAAGEDLGERARVAS